MGFLRLCKQWHRPVSVELAKQYLAARPMQDGNEAREALRWFVRAGRKADASTDVTNRTNRTDVAGDFAAHGAGGPRAKTCGFREATVEGKSERLKAEDGGRSDGRIVDCRTVRRTAPEAARLQDGVTLTGETPVPPGTAGCQTVASGEARYGDPAPHRAAGPLVNPSGHGAEDPARWGQRAPPAEAGPAKAGATDTDSLLTSAAKGAISDPLAYAPAFAQGATAGGRGYTDLGPALHGNPRARLGSA